MALSGKTVAKIFFIYLAYFMINTVMGTKIQNLAYDFGKLEICNKDSEQLVSPGQVYGCCGNKILYKMVKDRSTLHCTFIMETTKAIDSPDHLRICNFSLESNPTMKYPNSRLNYEFKENGYFHITAIKKDKALLQLIGRDRDSYDKLHLFYILHFNGCRASKINLLHDATEEYFVNSVFGDNFDIDFINDTSRRFIRATFDTQGNIIKKGEPWIPSGNATIFGAIYSPGNGRLVIENEYLSEDDNAAKIIMARNDGSFKLLKEKPMDKDNFLEIRYPSQIVITSFKYNLASVCTKLNRILTCSQYDNNGNEKFETKILLHNNPIMLMLSLHNLPNGGFLLISSECDEIHDYWAGRGHSFFVVKKFDATGRLVASAKSDINDPNTKQYEKIHAFESEENELCLSYVHLTEDIFDEMVHLNVYCFQDDDFSPVTV